jgi:hypothetical protein
MHHHNKQYFAEPGDISDMIDARVTDAEIEQWCHDCKIPFPRRGKRTADNSTPNLGHPLFEFFWDRQWLFRDKGQAMLFKLAWR